MSKRSGALKVWHGVAGMQQKEVNRQKDRKTISPKPAELHLILARRVEGEQRNAKDAKRD